MKQEDRIKTSMELRRDIWARVKAQAVLEGRPAILVVEDALASYLKAHKGGK